MNLVAPFGFFGAGNIGDESTLQGFARLVSRCQQGAHVWVASRNPAHTARVEPSFHYYKARGRDPRRWWARFRSSAQVIVGGTPIMDVLGTWPLSELAPLVRAAHDRQKPVVFLGAGTEHLRQEESKRVVAETLAPRVERWSVKSERDKERLADYGVAPESITVAADLAWMLDPVPSDFGREYLAQLGFSANASYVGVNVNNERFVVEKEPQLFEKVGAFLDTLIKEHDAHVLFFANEVREGKPYDKVASEKVLACMSRRDRAFQVPNQYWAPQEMLSLISRCRLTVGMRYHFCLFSALQGIPFIALKRSDKVDDLCWDMNWPYAVSLPGLSVSALLDMFSDVERQRCSLVGQLRECARVMRERTLRSSMVLKGLVRNTTG